MANTNTESTVAASPSSRVARERQNDLTSERRTTVALGEVANVSRIVTTGARDHKLPDEYIEALEGIRTLRVRPNVAVE